MQGKLGKKKSSWNTSSRASFGLQVHGMEPADSRRAGEQVALRVNNDLAFCRHKKKLLRIMIDIYTIYQAG